MSPAPDNAALGEVAAPHDAFRIALPNFEGPLDLLLHLIREHKLDILDIPIALVTEKYLAHLEKMRVIDLDVAGEFLVMASTLLHLKSRMLLPREEQPADQVAPLEATSDPRAELVRRLLEYQKYKDVAEQLSRHDLLDRTSFPRRVAVAQIPLSEDEVGFHEISVYKLIEALDRVLAALEPKKQHEVIREHFSLSEAIRRVAAKLRDAGKGNSISFFSLFEGARTRGAVVTTFIALLEMVKLKLVRVFQAEGEEDIRVSARGEAIEAMAEGASVTPPALQELDHEYQ